MLYVIAGSIGFILAMLLIRVRPSQFERNLSSHLSAGKRVILSIEDEAYIFELVNGKVQITMGHAIYTPEEGSEEDATQQPSETE